MSGETLLQVEYYNKANIVDPIKAIETYKSVGSDFVVNSELLSNSERNKEENFLPLLSFGVAKWEYYRPKLNNLYPNVVVIRDKKHPYQRIICPEFLAKSFAEAYFYLSYFYKDNEFHNMDIVVSAFRNPKSRSKNPHYMPPEGNLFTEELLDNTGVYNLVKDSKFRRIKPEHLDTGIWCDVKQPVFLLVFRPTRIKEYPLYIAGAIVHDFTHFKQHHTGLPVYDDRSELQAMTNEATFLFRLSNIINHKGAQYHIRLRIQKLQKLMNRIRTGAGSHVYKKYVSNSSAEFPPIKYFH